MKNFIEEGKVLTLPAPYAVASGGGAKIGRMFGVAVKALESGESGAFNLHGCYTLPKTSAQAWASVGLLIYWDDSAKKCTTVATGNTLIGVNIATAANPSSYGDVRLNGAYVETEIIE